MYRRRGTRAGGIEPRLREDTGAVPRWAVLRYFGTQVPAQVPPSGQIRKLPVSIDKDLPAHHKLPTCQHTQVRGHVPDNLIDVFNKHEPRLQHTSRQLVFLSSNREAISRQGTARGSALT